MQKVGRRSACRRRLSKKVEIRRRRRDDLWPKSRACGPVGLRHAAGMPKTDQVRRDVALEAGKVSVRAVPRPGALSAAMPIFIWLHSPPAQVQPDAGGPGIQPAVLPGKALVEHPRQVGGRDADAVVGNGQGDGVLSRRAPVKRSSSGPLRYLTALDRICPSTKPQLFASAVTGRSRLSSTGAAAGLDQRPGPAFQRVGHQGRAGWCAPPGSPSRRRRCGRSTIPAPPAAQCGAARRPCAVRRGVLSFSAISRAEVMGVLISCTQPSRYSR